MVENRVLERTEYYANFGRRNETFHLAGARHQLSTRDGGIVSKVALCRPRTMVAFSTVDLDLLDRLVPHLCRALQLRHQIEPWHVLLPLQPIRLHAAPCG